MDQSKAKNNSGFSSENNAATRSYCPRIGRVVVANAPVRIDLAGGWSDTPPICYETQGAVSFMNCDRILSNRNLVYIHALSQEVNDESFWIGLCYFQFLY